MISTSETGHRAAVKKDLNDIMTRSLVRRQASSTCGSDSAGEDYNLALQVGALFIILTVSASACAFPLIASKFPRLRIPLKFLFVVRHFGTGVLLATAFVHLLPTAFVSLTDPCLPSFWTEDYPAITGAIALASVFAITSVEMLLSPGRKCCSTLIVDPENTNEKSDATATSSTAGILSTSDGRQPGPLHGRNKLGRSHSTGREFGRVLHRESTAELSEQTSTFNEVPRGRSSSRDSAESNEVYTIPTAKDDVAKQKKAALQCVLLEIGILFHSVFIGMSLAVSTGSDLTVLLIAITFHQFFEGLALGARIATVSWKNKALQPWLMAVAYGCTTPIGQAIGIATSDLYDPNSQTGLLVVGIMNAISSGLLTYTSLVDLLSEDFLSDESWKVLKGNKRAIAFSLVFLGAFLMSLVGAWA